MAWSALPRDSRSTSQQQVAAAIDDQAAFSRRSAAIWGSVLSQFPSASASAEEVAASSAATKIQRLTVNVPDTAALQQEVNFWLEACQMTKLKETVGADGAPAVLVGHGSDESGFGVLLQVKPSAGKAAPSLLNYNIMQPNVNALNFVELRVKGRVIEVFNRIESSGGTPLIGDATFIDAESPGRVPVRLIPIKEGSPSVDFVCFNVEVPAFEGTVKFYQRALGFKKASIPAGTPPVQKLSEYLTSPVGGPRLMLSPVPDGRMKDRKLDEFEELVLTSSNVDSVVANGRDAIKAAADDEARKVQELESRILSSDGEARRSFQVQKDLYLKGTRSRPALDSFGNGIGKFNDGVGTQIVVASETALSR